MGIEERVSKLVLPLGMTLNSKRFCSMHMGDHRHHDLSDLWCGILNDELHLYCILGCACLLWQMPWFPGAGLVSLAIVVPQMNLPIESIALFAGVEWFVGMLRTILNVTADTTTALIVAKTEDAIDYDIFNHGIIQEV